MVFIKATIYCDGWRYPDKQGQAIQNCQHKIEVSADESSVRTDVARKAREAGWWRDTGQWRFAFVCPDCRRKMTGRKPRDA